MQTFTTPCCKEADSAAAPLLPSDTGYTGNFAGHVGATLAFMAGLFNSPHASNYKASNVWDVIPCDVVANVILASAAAVGQGAESAIIATPTNNGRIITDATRSSARLGTDRMAAQGKPGAMVSAAAGSRRGGHQIQLSAFSSSAGPLPEESDTDVDAHHGLDQRDSGKVEEPQHSLLIIHCGSSTIYPLTIMESWNWGVEVYGAWPSLNNLVMGTCVGPMLSDHEPNPGRAAYYMYLTGLKIWLAGKFLR